MRSDVQEEAGKQVLRLSRQLIGNLDEVTDLCLIGLPSAPTQLALATNSPTIRMFDLGTMSCSATLVGHTDTVLVLDAMHAKGKLISSQIFRAHFFQLAPLVHTVGICFVGLCEIRG